MAPKKVCDTRNKAKRKTVRTMIELKKAITVQLAKALDKTIYNSNFWASEPIIWFSITSYGKYVFSY